MEGKYFLLKLNVSEVMEHVNQTSIYFQFYNCNMTVGYVVHLCSFAFEAWHNALVLLRGKITVSVRDHQAMVDLFIDFSARAFLCSCSIMDKQEATQSQSTRLFKYV